MEVVGAAEHVPIDLGRRKRARGPGCGQDRAVTACVTHQDDCDPGEAAGFDEACGDIDATILERSAQQRAQRVITEHADQGGAQTQPGRTAGHDARRSADGEQPHVHKFLDLPENRHRIITLQHEICVDVSNDEEIDVSFHKILLSCDRSKLKPSWLR